MNNSDNPYSPKKQRNTSEGKRALPYLEDTSTGRIYLPRYLAKKINTPLKNKAQLGEAILTLWIESELEKIRDEGAKLLAEKNKTKY